MKIILQHLHSTVIHSNSWQNGNYTIIIQLITLRELKRSYLSIFHHQPSDFFRTGLLWRSTAADGLLQGGDGTVPSWLCDVIMWCHEWCHWWRQMCGGQTFLLYFTLNNTWFTSITTWMRFLRKSGSFSQVARDWLTEADWLIDWLRLTHTFVCTEGMIDAGPCLLRGSRTAMSVPRIELHIFVFVLGEVVRVVGPPTQTRFKCTHGVFRHPS